MSEGRHTPGPWHAWRRMADYHIRSGDPLMDPVSVGTARWLADANVISASPDMLAALEGLDEFLPDPGSCPDPGKSGFLRATIAARAAIAKARGQA